ncbi:DNA-binding transcription repressor [Coemansia sp. RSA 1199]|nr:DNA-binding transcription repressor [Coemansia sp. RSA 1199]
MATTYDRAADAAGRHRNKRKGIPKRSPCRRDMVESPGVVFRFPDKINPGTREVPGLSILPSAAGLPSGLGAKSAAAVIAAAAAVSAASAGNAALSAALTPTTAATALTSIPAAPVASDSSALTATDAVPQPAALASADLPKIDSAHSTPILRPAPAGVPIHRSASNVLHYPELLSDLRDKLIQVHQSGAHANTSSGVESDSSHPAQHAIRRAKPRRTAKTAEIDDSSAGAASRRTGLRGVAGSAASTSSPNPGSTGLRTRHEAESESARTFHRRHSISTIRQQQQQQDDGDEIVDIDDSASTSSRLTAEERQAKSAKRKREKDAGRHSQSPAKRPAPQNAVGGRRCCASCGASSTPCWRPGLIDRMTLCNLCGLRYKKGKVYCAGCSYVPTKTEIATGGASACKRCTLSIHKQPASFGLDL